MALISIRIQHPNGRHVSATVRPFLFGSEFAAVFGHSGYRGQQSDSWLNGSFLYFATRLLFTCLTTKLKFTFCFTNRLPYRLMITYIIILQTVVQTNEDNFLIVFRIKRLLIQDLFLSL